MLKSINYNLYKEWSQIVQNNLYNVMIHYYFSKSLPNTHRWHLEKPSSICYVKHSNSYVHSTRGHVNILQTYILNDRHKMEEIYVVVSSTNMVIHMSNNVCSCASIHKKDHDICTIIIMMCLKYYCESLLWNNKYLLKSWKQADYRSSSITLMTNYI